MLWSPWSWEWKRRTLHKQLNKVENTAHHLYCVIKVIITQQSVCWRSSIRDNDFKKKKKKSCSVLGLFWSLQSWLCKEGYFTKWKTYWTILRILFTTVIQLQMVFSQTCRSAPVKIIYNNSVRTLKWQLLQQLPFRDYWSIIELNWTELSWIELIIKQRSIFEHDVLICTSYLFFIMLSTLCHFGVKRAL